MGTELDGSERRGPIPRSAACRRTRPGHRTGRRRAWWPWRNGTMPRQAAATAPGLAWKIYPGAWTELPDLTKRNQRLQRRIAKPARRRAGIHALRSGVGRLIDIPADGGYTFHLLDSRRRAAGDRRRGGGEDRSAVCAGLRLAGQCACATTAARSVCAPAGTRCTWRDLHSVSQGPAPAVGGPGVPLTDVPPTAYEHVRTDVIVQ